ncbi:DUF4268 domain-containing protein [Tautonia plasticadhaerens]|uniref:DUF4268 domain-containing protein n=1 Tax=Tautonia plasticadhaerens TaxID=2527974 RepID=UPI0021BCA616|nr:DUF4268 domain-containing protein [Tautonia plasticadhaerens]
MDRCGLRDARPGLQLRHPPGGGDGRVVHRPGRGGGRGEKRLFDRLLGQKEEIERAFGGELSWQRLDSKRGCRIAHIVTLGGYRSDESRWPEIQDAMIDGMVRLERALKPQIAALRSDFA